jgi:CheY-like chemotaxis protein
MKRLQEVSTRLIDDGVATGLLPEIIDAAIASTGADMGNTQLIDRASNTLRIVVSRGLLANNGREVLALLRIEEQGAGTESPQVPDIDVLLLDLHMPELDGFQVVRAIRAREKSMWTHLPVITLTARSRPEDRERCLAAGMDDYLAKPGRAAELFAAINRAVSAFRRPAADDSR